MLLFSPAFDRAGDIALFSWQERKMFKWRSLAAHSLINIQDKFYKHFYSNRNFLWPRQNPSADCNANEKISNNNNLTNEQIKEETKKRYSERERILLAWLASHGGRKSRSEWRAACALFALIYKGEYCKEKGQEKVKQRRRTRLKKEGEESS